MTFINCFALFSTKWSWCHFLRENRSIWYIRFGMQHLYLARVTVHNLLYLNRSLPLTDFPGLSCSHVTPFLTTPRSRRTLLLASCPGSVCGMDVSRCTASPATIFFTEIYRFLPHRCSWSHPIHQHLFSRNWSKNRATVITFEWCNRHQAGRLLGLQLLPPISMLVAGCSRFESPLSFVFQSLT
jgi:hypothetical protein